jgi:hypothetical protein
MNRRISTNLESITRAILIAIVVFAPGSAQPSLAADSTARGVEGPRDMNLFQIEPTVLNERHYTSGRAERHQKTSPTLPEGSPIPDNYTGSSYPMQLNKTEAVPVDSAKHEVKKEEARAESAPPMGSAESKVEPGVLSELNSIKPGEKRYVKLRLSCSTVDPAFVKTMKAVKSLKVVSVDKEKNEIVVEAQISTVSEIEAMKEITRVSAFQKP